MKEKWVKLRFIKLNAKASPKLSKEGWLFVFFFFLSGSSKRSEFFKNLIVGFKGDRFVLTIKYSDPHKRMFKSFSPG